MSDPTPPAEPDPQPAANEPAVSQDQSEPDESLIARFGLMKSIGRFTHDFESSPRPKSKVVVRTRRGVELGEVVAAVCAGDCQLCVASKNLEGFLAAAGPDYPFEQGGKVLRLANRQDIIDARHLEGQAKEEGTFCRQQIRQAGLDMRIITVEHLLGGERIIFYFAAEQRVDFRELVGKLAAQYRTRIEMRQVGARDEARLVADYERCGRRCCCQGFLKHLKPVSMRMAKVQKATLDPTKISGRCGRLMCCLRYEDATYGDLKKILPRKNTWVRTADAVGRVVNAQILTQLVRLQLAQGQFAVVANEDILERDVPDPSAKPKSPPATPAAVTDEQPQARGPQASEPAQVQADSGQGAAEAVAAGPQTAAPKAQPRKNRRRRRRKPRSERPAGQQPPATPADSTGASQQAGQPATKARTPRRRRRRRKTPPPTN